MRVQRFTLSHVSKTSLQYAEDPEGRDTSAFILGRDHDMMTKRRESAELFLAYSIKTYAAILLPLLEHRNASVFRRVQIWLKDIATTVQTEVANLFAAAAKGAFAGGVVYLLLSFGRNLVVGGTPSAAAPLRGAAAGAVIGILHHLNNCPERLRLAIERSKQQAKLSSLVAAIENSLESLEHMLLRASVRTLLQYQLSIMNFKPSSVKRFAVLKARLGIEYCSHDGGYYPENMSQADTIDNLTSVLNDSSIIKQERFSGSVFAQKFKYDRELRKYYTSLMKHHRIPDAYFFHGYLAWSRKVTFEELHDYSNAVYFGEAATLYFQQTLQEKRHKSYRAPPILLRNPTCKGEERCRVTEIEVRIA